MRDEPVQEGVQEGVQDVAPSAARGSIAPADGASTASDPALYDGVADQWWSGETRWVRTLGNMVPARMRFFERSVPDWRGLKTLDLGCAGGFMAEALDARGAVVSGIDPAADAVAAARAHAAATGRDIDYRIGVGEALPYADDTFDAVVCVDVLEHVSDLDKVLGEVRRVVKPGGWFLFDTINKTLLARLAVVVAAERVLGLLPRGAHDPALFIKPSTLRGKLTALGFDVGRFSGLSPTFVNRRLDPTFGIVPTTAIIYIGSARAPR